MNTDISLDELTEKMSGVSCENSYEWKKLHYALRVYKGEVRLSEQEMVRFMEDTMLRYRRILREVVSFNTQEELELYCRIKDYVIRGQHNIEEAVEIDYIMSCLID